MYINSQHFEPGDKLRITVERIDDPPWPTERPEGWGAGCWLRALNAVYLLVSDEDSIWIDVLDVSNKFINVIHVDQILSFGPRVEVPSC